MNLFNFKKCPESLLKLFANFLLILLLFVIIFSNTRIHAQDKIELKHADELSGSVVDNQNVREAKGNVEFVQGNVKVFCNSATQYVDANRVELRGEVRIYQDTLSLFTSKATYFGDDRRAVCEGGVTLKDPNATVRADDGIYFFNDSRAIFRGDVIIVNPEYKITSSELTYLRATEDSFAKGKVVVTTETAVIKANYIDFFKSQGRTFARESVTIESDSTIIIADTATNYSREKKSEASGNVTIRSLTNNTTITGDYIQNLELSNYTILIGDTELTQTEENEDTLHIYSDTMEAFREIPEIYIAKGNVEIIKGEFLSKSGAGTYFRDAETIAMTREPVLWQENLQMTGDTIYAELPDKILQTIYVKKLPISNSTTPFVISQNEDVYFNDRYDQISGNDIKIRFIEDKINFIEVNDNSSSIYFMFEDNRANGLNKVDGQRMIIYFDASEKVSKIKVENNPKGEYIPEELIGSTSLSLPGFNLRDDKPVLR